MNSLTDSLSSINIDPILKLPPFEISLTPLTKRQTYVIGLLSIFIIGPCQILYKPKKIFAERGKA